MYVRCDTDYNDYGQEELIILSCGFGIRCLIPVLQGKDRQ